MPDSPGPVNYRGNCHCGRYRFELAVPEEITACTACTCSLCVKNGYLWVAPVEGSFKVVRDDGRTSEYSSSVLRETFCNFCGNGVTGEHLAGVLKGQFLVNVRSLHGVDPFAIE